MPNPAVSPQGTAVSAVIPVFRPDAQLAAAVRVLAPQVARIIIINDDPAPVGATVQEVFSECSRLGAELVSHHRNLGIAAALNTGLSALIECSNPADAVLTLDQDSFLPRDYVRRLLSTWHEAELQGVRVGMIAPASAGNIRHLPTAGHRGRVTIGGEPIQSGLLIPKSTFDAIGRFDASLFIDSVDSDFYLRALDAGFTSIISDIGIDHHLGNRVHVTFGPFRLEIIVADASRYYYQVRNLVIMAKRHGKMHRVWLLRAIAKELRHLAVVSALAPKRMLRLRMAARGLRDGVLSHSGVLDRSTA